MSDKIHNKMNWQIFLIPALMIILAAAVYSMLPEQIPTHFNAGGVPDSYGPRGTIFLLPLISLAVALMKNTVVRIDPKKKNYTKFGREYSFIILFIELFLFVVQLFITLYAMGYPLNISRLITMLVGILLAVCGNYMPRFRQNYFCGIKTPWTLASEEVWFQTHRMGGKLMFAGGLLIMLTAFFPPGLQVPVTVVIALLVAGIPYLYSYLLFRKTNPEDPS